jgi:hypothetical protein
MEVHHHPNLRHEKKPWKEYFLEGLMIFLAVTMGFFAESYREHINDRAKETDYMISLARDLQNDITEAKITKKIKLTGISFIDSALQSFDNGDYKRKTADLYYWARMLGLRDYFEPNDGTIQQLNNAGGLRLIHNRHVLDSIQKYINQTKDLLTLQGLEETQLVTYKESFSVVFDAQAMNRMYINGGSGQTLLKLKKLNFDPPLISYDKKDINTMNMKLVVLKGIRLSEAKYIDVLVTKAGMLRQLVKKEYNLEDDE